MFCLSPHPPAPPKNNKSRPSELKGGNVLLFFFSSKLLLRSTLGGHSDRNLQQNCRRGNKPARVIRDGGGREGGGGQLGRQFDLQLRHLPFWGPNYFEIECRPFLVAFNNTSKTKKKKIKSIKTKNIETKKTAKTKKSKRPKGIYRQETANKKKKQNTQQTRNKKNDRKKNTHTHSKIYFSSENDLAVIFTLSTSHTQYESHHNCTQPGRQYNPRLDSDLNIERGLYSRLQWYVEARVGNEAIYHQKCPTRHQFRPVAKPRSSYSSHSFSRPTRESLYPEKGRVRR